MKQVFSRWPSLAADAGSVQVNEAGVELPAWMLARPQNPWLQRLRRMRLAVVLVLLPSASAFAAGMLIGQGQGHAAWVQIGASIAIVIVSFLMAFALSGALADAKARERAIFDRAGISMWLEDWTAAGREVAALRRSGVADLEAHYAERPAELRALRSKVMIKDVNAFAVEETGAHGKDECIGSLDLLLPDTDQTFVQWLVAFGRGDRYFRSEAHLTKADGAQLDTLFTAALPDDLEGFANIITTSMDITAYKQQQAQLGAIDSDVARASRTSTVGAFSASIAHEVNSPLAAVLANAQAALRWLRRAEPEVQEATEAVAAIVADATRARDVIARTRSFLSNAPTSLQQLDIVAAAREANLLVEGALREAGCAVHINAHHGLPFVEGDLVQIQQVFTNLLLNAAQAMASQPGPRDITISISRCNAGVCVAVSDTGPGIAPERLERIFDPFQTTKPRGMGMGLAICRNCIEAQGGRIWASSVRGAGATFHFTVPIRHG